MATSFVLPRGVEQHVISTDKYGINELICKSETRSMDIFNEARG